MLSICERKTLPILSVIMISSLSLSSVWVRLGIFSPLSIIQYVWLCVFSLPISVVKIERIYILCLIIIIKSEVWTITHCLGLGHETMVCAVCLSIFLLLFLLWALEKISDILQTTLRNMFSWMKRNVPVFKFTCYHGNANPSFQMRLVRTVRSYPVIWYATFTRTAPMGRTGTKLSVTALSVVQIRPQSPITSYVMVWSSALVEKMKITARVSTCMNWPNS